MAEVYRGIHHRLEREVAIKILPESLAAEADFRNRFEREAQSVAALRHPNIVQVYDFGDLDGMYYMVMEYVNGQNLSEFMEGDEKIPLHLALSIIRDLASALDYAHQRQIVHRDVKPSNVLLQATPNRPVQMRAILTDFGIAKIRSRQTGATKTGMMIGTLDYMAPEQIRSAGEVDGRADTYSLGVLVYKILTGQNPFSGENPGALMLAHLQTIPADPREINPSLSASTALAILKAMSKRPEDRFASAGEFVNGLQ